MWLFALFVVVPLIEIALFIQVGGFIGLWPTMAIVLATALLGSALMRAQGRQVLADLRNSTERMSNPLSPLAHGALILFGGALLLTPGFFTDTLGILLLIPTVRSFVIAHIGSRIQVQTTGFGASHSQQTAARHRDDVIDVEFTEIEIDPKAKPGDSGSTRH